MFHLIYCTRETSKTWKTFCVSQDYGWRTVMAGELLFLALCVDNASDCFINAFREHSSICEKKKKMSSLSVYFPKRSCIGVLSEWLFLLYQMTDGALISLSDGFCVLQEYFLTLLLLIHYRPISLRNWLMEHFRQGKSSYYTKVPSVFINTLKLNSQELAWHHWHTRNCNLSVCVWYTCISL